MPNYRACAFAALPALLACPAYAADAPQATPQSVEIKGEAGKYNARRDDTAAKVVVTEAEIAKYGDTSLTDVLKRQAGITLDGAPGQGGGIRMRGLGNGYTQILINGEAATPGFSIDSLAPSLIEKIEISRTATADTSTQAIAGSINIILRKSVKAGRREAKVTLGTADVAKTLNSSLMIADKLKDFSYSVGANFNALNFNQDPDIVEQEDDGQGHLTALRRATRADATQRRMMSLAPRLQWALDGGSTLVSQSLFNFSRVTRNAPRSWNIELGEPPQILRDKLNSRVDQTLLKSDLTWTRRIDPQSQLELKGGGTLLDGDARFAELGFGGNGATVLDRISTVDERQSGGTFGGKYRTQLIDKHTFVAGWDLARTKRHETQLRTERQLGQALSDATQYRSVVDRAALFAQDEWTIDPKLSFYLGLRWESIRTRSTGNDFSPVENRSNVISPILQTLWKLPNSDKDQVRLALSRTYKAVEPAQLVPRLVRALENSSVTPDLSGNPLLKPELAWGLDASYEHYFTEDSLISISAYTKRIDDFIRPNLRFNGERWVLAPTNDGRARTHGVEIETKFPLKLMWNQAPAIDVRFSLARNWSSVDQVPGPDNRFADQTPVSATTGLDYQASPTFSAGGTFTFSNGGPLQISRTQFTYATVRRDLDLYALWKLNPRYQARLSVMNLLGQSYRFVNGYRDGSGSHQLSTEYPVSPLLRITLETVF
ncbi:TonB-dependent receptor plug domain-containing protein [Massilia rubra]|uniref:TonB-dependent receptor plug domain-containing protein n=1 Tax=Massilia rubra TaxID=2607910 RepID=A0ABX0LWP4_9BURK|nr:TonB-dependent receptor [Massilia rubra]NHZ35809.1 TonB-dependent receptor plug domain-containing protein [Massilia rubra]